MVLQLEDCTDIFTVLHEHPRAGRPLFASDQQSMSCYFYSFSSGQQLRLSDAQHSAICHHVQSPLITGRNKTDVASSVKSRVIVIFFPFFLFERSKDPKPLNRVVVLVGCLVRCFK
jgi:hypothetical protein